MVDLLLDRKRTKDYNKDFTSNILFLFNCIAEEYIVEPEEREAKKCNFGTNVFIFKIFKSLKI